MSEQRLTARERRRSGISSAKIATAIVMVGLILSKGSGFIRDIVVSHRFDETYRDAFSLAFTIPDLFYNLIIGGAVYSSIAPYMSGALAVNEEKRGIRTISIFVSVISVVMIIVCVLGVVFANPIYQLYALDKSDIDPETLTLAASASRLLFPQIFFMMLAALCMGILNSYRRFNQTALAPFLYNVFVILAIYFLADNSEYRLMMTTGGILVASLIYFFYQYIVGFDKLKSFRFIFKPRDPEFIKLLKRALPIMFSTSVVQINVIVLNYFAGNFDKGSIYALRNASTIWQIPYGVFTVAISTIMTPNIAAAFEAKRYKDTSNYLSNSLKSALFIAIPCAGFIALMSTDVVKAIYQWSSNYTDENASKASVFLIGYCFAIVTHSVVHLYNQAFNSIGRTKIPLYAGCIGLISNPLVCIILTHFNFGPIALTIAYSVTSVLQMLVLLILYRRDKAIAPHGVIKSIMLSFMCSIVMCLVIFCIDIILPGNGSKAMQLTIIAIKGILAISIYFGMALMLKMEEATYWINWARDKIFSRVIVKMESRRVLIILMPIYFLVALVGYFGITEGVASEIDLSNNKRYDITVHSVTVVEEFTTGAHYYNDRKSQTVVKTFPVGATMDIHMIDEDGNCSKIYYRTGLDENYYIEANVKEYVFSEDDIVRLDQARDVARMERQGEIDTLRTGFGYSIGGYIVILVFVLAITILSNRLAKKFAPVPGTERVERVTPDSTRKAAVFIEAFFISVSIYAISKAPVFVSNTPGIHLITFIVRIVVSIVLAIVCALVFRKIPKKYNWIHIVLIMVFTAAAVMSVILMFQYLAVIS
ncbi:MAG: murein biosynthesis integral membrane protein MurJ [Saccharofermentans sp.]|nr:murein biosynthesis integral membrane protein MurJ [Saccharofermentans sp.]